MYLAWASWTQCRGWCFEWRARPCQQDGTIVPEGASGDVVECSGHWHVEWQYGLESRGTVLSYSYSSNLELHTILWHLFYLRQEFTAVMISVYIPTKVDNNKVLSDLQDVMCSYQAKHPDAALIMEEDFNRVMNWTTLSSDLHINKASPGSSGNKRGLMLVCPISGDAAGCTQWHRLGHLSTSVKIDEFEDTVISFISMLVETIISLQQAKLSPTTNQSST